MIRDVNAQTVKIGISEREISTIIAALAAWKFFRVADADNPNEYVEIATNGGLIVPLDNDEIEKLIEDIAEAPNAQG